MTIWLILGLFCLIGISNYLLGQYQDKRTIVNLENYLQGGQKNDPKVSIHRWAGYGGGSIIFSDANFFFSDDDSLFKADGLIKNSFYQVINRLSW